MSGRLRVVLAGLLASAVIPIFVGADETPGSVNSAASEIQLQLGDLLFQEGRYTEAADAYDRAKDGAGARQLLRAVGGLVKSLLRVAEFGRAREEAVTLRSRAPTDPSAIAIYADAVWAGGLFDEAEQAFAEALALNPDEPRARHGLAKALAARNQLEEAMREAQAALRLMPRDPEFHHTVGSIYEQMHRFDEAAAAFGNYVNLLPNKDTSERAAWSRATIRFLRSFGKRVPYEVVEDGQITLHTVPFRLVRDKVVVQGSVNGGRRMEFVLDTGSEETVISRRAAQRHGVAALGYTLSAGVGEVGLRGLQIGRLDSLEIGSLKVRNVPCLIKNPPLGGLPSREGESFSPLAMGLSMVIDYQRRVLTIGRSLPDEPFDLELPMRVHRLAMIRGTIMDRHPASFVIDTGGEVISLSTATASRVRPRVSSRRIPLKVYGTSGWDREAFLMPGVDLAFDEIRYENFPVVVLNLRAPSALLGFQVGGIIGHKFLSQYRVVIDLDRSVVRLSRS